MLAETEIGELNMTLGIKQDVIGLQISMNVI
jgi:hypothetical protein